MKVYEDEKTLCCGCSACMAICPEKAITMMEDKEGFCYPGVSSEKCIHCGKCKNVCQIFTTKKNTACLFIFGVKHKDNNVVKKSSSGGAFTAISDFFLKNAGVVYATAFTDDFDVCFQRAVTSQERDHMRGSKYVQSYMGDTFSCIREDLLKHKKVLFIGSSCYVAGLLLFLDDIDTSTLFTCDFVCRGVPSPKLWKEYIVYLEEKYHDKLIDFQFRNKSKGWRHNHYKLTFSNRIIYENWTIQKWHKLFSKNLTYRPICYQCKYADYEKPSDITIGDFFRIIESHPEFDNNEGVSLFMIHTDKGLSLYDKIKSDIETVETNRSETLQDNLYKPSLKPDNRDIFWEDYYKYGFSYIIKKYTKPTVKEVMECKIIVPLLQKIGLYNKVIFVLGKLRKIKGKT